MKKVECPSCGGTGVIRHGHRWPWEAPAYHQCRRCTGFGFILMDLAVFPKFKPIKVSRYPRMIAPIDEYREFTGLVKVRNIGYVLVGQFLVPYGEFYKEHKKHP